MCILHKRYLYWKRNLILPYLNEDEKVLDFGCGDLSLARALIYKLPNVNITGVDVVNFKKKDKGIKFVLYDGKTLPFKDNLFDTVITMYVFHHTDNIEESFSECVRVAKKRIILIESIPRFPLELPFMSILDLLYNLAKRESISMTFRFKTLKEWKKVFKKNNLTLKSLMKKNQVFIPPFFPFGISYVFEVVK